MTGSSDDYISDLAGSLCDELYGVPHDHIQVSQQDSTRYVVFPTDAQGALYHFYRPLSFADEQLTGMKRHLGPLA